MNQLETLISSEQLCFTFPKTRTFDHFKYFTNSIEPFYKTDLGALFSADCMKILPLIRENSIDTVFADPPFNLGKKYGSNTNDSIPDEEYVSWCRSWVAECCRVLKPGGSIFIYNIPKWNILLGAYLSKLGFTFRHWIAIEINSCLPISGRLYPSHYSLLYYSKGKPKTFRKIRTPIQICRHCGGEVKDYGGHRNAMNPNGVNLKDVWSDIPPVRHRKFKSQSRKANALSTKILDRVVEMSTFPGDIVLDPFGGSGTTYVVCEQKNRFWLGTEIDFAKEVVKRLETAEIKSHKNDDFVEE
ncbi:MAG: site-specific DNA-methyltransferase [Candidatus Riflebacteria bacterium]|nr:site-specific DNA-methyltransferase [Candidatus Riflebacteria bacterium]